MGAVQDSELIGRRLAEIELVLVASPNYYTRAGRPETAAELARHECITLSSGFVRWCVQDVDIPITPRFSAHSLSAARLAALAGLGIARLPEFEVTQDLATGDLVRALPNVKLPRTPATALYPRTVVPSTALRLLLDELGLG